MKETIGMRAFLIFLAALLVSGTMVPAVSAENESRGWLDTFDQWVEPRDMSMYTPVIETPQRVPITEEIARQHPGVIILEPKRVSEFQVVGADVVPTSPGKVSLTLQAESSDLGTRDLMPDVRMTQGTISWYWTQDTFVYHEITIHNYASSAASGMVILWSLEEGYGCGVPFSDLAAGADLTVTVPFEVLPQHSSIGIKPMAVEIRVDPTGLTS